VGQAHEGQKDSFTEVLPVSSLHGLQLRDGFGRCRMLNRYKGSQVCNWNLQVQRSRWPRRQNRPTGVERRVMLQYGSLLLGDLVLWIGFV
jgi:hypothetical protein